MRRGQVLRAKVMYEDTTATSGGENGAASPVVFRQSKGYGFVDYGSFDEADTAVISLNGVSLGGHPILARLSLW